MFSSTRKKDKIKKNTFFLRNGAAVLEQVISYFNGDCNPIRSYSPEQLKKATSNFQWKIHGDSSYDLYEGIHEDRKISVKRFKSDLREDHLKEIANEVAVASRMSNHRNVLKLLGYCLETKFPILVYEFPTRVNLSSYIHDDIQQLPWECKLRIVTEIANAIGFLHNGLPKTIIHRDIKTRNVFLDQNDTAKLFEFQAAIPIPEGKNYVHADAYGTFGFVAPEAAYRGLFTEKSDVYSFGVLLFEVLTGKKFTELIEGKYELLDELSTSSLELSNFQDNLLLGIQSDYFWVKIQAKYCELIYLEEQENIRAQVEECAKLARRCVELNPDKRPNMIQVTIKGVVLLSVSLSREVVPGFARILMRTSLGKRHLVRPLLRTEITQVVNRRAWYDATKLTTEVLSLYKV
ncbi:Serine/threonine protein kinase [Parasponia andersonii]|uniref:Serine/threonine protein kinase n=1 Tax=Parasponia andersonii TaxID=3476 RepID=A0A2P5DX10_PARAD|nr:Serine/threonine protein kinase [Parasponia andersonii]